MGSQIVISVEVFVLGLLSAWMDIDSFFRSKRVSFIAGGSISFWLFILFNGALSAVILAWSLSSPNDSTINKIIQVDSPFGKMVVIGFGVPLLIRSKLFSFGEEQTAAGPAIAYDWIRLKTLVAIHRHSLKRKQAIIDKYAQSFAGRGATRAALVGSIRDFVNVFVNPFVTPSQQAQLDKEFANINASYTGANEFSTDHFRALVRWSMDNTSIQHADGQLASL